MDKNNLTASKENYIKAIYEIVNKKQAARVKDISGFLGIGASSVTEALRKLSDEGYVNYEQYGVITLTKQGTDIARQIEERNKVIRDFLSNVLLIKDENLAEHARQIEHGIKGDLLDKLVSFFQFTQICPCKEPKWLRGYKAYSLNGNKVNDKCFKCISYCRKNNLTKPFPENTGDSCCNSCD